MTWRCWYRPFMIGLAAEPLFLLVDGRIDAGYLVGKSLTIAGVLLAFEVGRLGVALIRRIRAWDAGPERL